MISTEHFVTIAPAEPALGETQPLCPPVEPMPAPIALPARDRALLYLAAGSSVLALVLAVALVLALGSRPTQAATTATKVAPSPTPALAVALPPAPPTIVAFWAPEGAVYGQIAIVGDVQITAQFQGWAQFRTAFMAAPLWAPIAALAGAVPVDRLAAAPELLPTAAPAPLAPQIVYVAAEPPTAEPSAPVVTPAPLSAENCPPPRVAAGCVNFVELQPTAAMHVLVDTADRYVVEAVPPPGTTAETDEWGAMGGGGGSWGP